MCAKSLQLRPTLCDPTVAHQAPLSIGFSRQEYWSGLPCPPPGDLPNPGIKPASLISPVLAGRFFTTSAIWEAVLGILQQKKKKKAWLQGDEFRASVSAANEQALLKADDSGDCSCHIWDVLRRLKQQTVYD